MSFSVAIQPSGRHFTMEATETVLGAAISAGIGLPYGCKNGACGSCKGKLVSGSVALGAHQERALSAAEQTAGHTLFCCAVPQSDVAIEAREVLGVGEFPIKKVPVRVARLERAADDVMILSLQMPATERMQYKAGQYVEFLLKDNKRRAYSIATPPHSDELLSLHLRHMPGGVFTDHVFGAMKERDILRFEGPLGTFFLREESTKPIVLLASGTGFAPIKAIVEHWAHSKSTRPVTLYWGGRRPADLYMDAWVQEQCKTMPHLRYVPVVSDALPEDHWTGRTGFVHRAVLEDFADLSGHQVYACGAPIVVDSAKRDFCAQAGLPADEFYADAFTSEADKVSA